MSENQSHVPVQFDSSLKIDTLKIFWSYLNPYKKQLVLAIFALTCSAIIILSVGFGLQAFMDQNINISQQRVIDKAFIFLVTCALVLAGAAFVRMTTTAWLSEQMTQDIRRDLFRHILTFDCSILENLTRNDLISRFEHDTALLQSALNSSLAVALRSSLQIIGSLVFLVITSLKLTGFVILMIPLCSLPLVFVGRQVRNQTAQTHQHKHALSIFIYETFMALKTVQSFCQEHHQAQRFDALSRSYLKATHLKGRSRALMVASIIAIVFGSIALTLWIGAQDVFYGKIHFGQLSAFIFYAVVAAGSLNSLSDVSGEIMTAAQGFKRICELKHISPCLRLTTLNLDADSNAASLSSQAQEFAIEFKNVTFSYPSQSLPALNNISFKTKPGQTVAVVGSSGAGKSTLFQLLLRFYDPQEGQIFVGDHNIKDFSLPQLRAIFAHVPQEPDIFDLSLHDNIIFSRPQAMSNEIYQATKLALVDAFVDSLPHGYDTKVGAQGTRLSGGQKQRLAIARAVLYQAPVLLLDEATNALDAECEYNVQKKLNIAFKKQTRLVIAHRLTTVIHADHILVLKQGRLIEQGNHAQLIQQNGFYAHLAQYQFSH